MESLEYNRPDQNLIPPFSIILMLLMAVFLGSMIGQGIVVGISASKGIDLQALITNLSIESPLEERNLLRLTNMIIHFMSFTVPPVLLTIFLFRSKWTTYLKLDQSPAMQNIGLGVLFILAAFPLAQIAFWLNRQIPFPQWIIDMETGAEGMIQSLLVMESPAELMLNLFVIAVLPALGEELLFRGVIQQELQKWTQRPILAIWIAAFIFSAFHFQFLGLFPRMILGAALGYLFYWTNNLWVPMVAHFITNGVQVIAQYATKQDISQLETEAPDLTTWAVSALALVAMYGLALFIKRSNNT